MEQQGILITRMDRIEPTHRNEYGNFEYKKYEVTKRKTGEQAYAALLRAARAGTISRSALQASYARIAALKRRFETQSP
jgi:hypothetical protein